MTNCHIVQLVSHTHTYALVCHTTLNIYASFGRALLHFILPVPSTIFVSSIPLHQTQPFIHPFIYYSTHTILLLVGLVVSVLWRHRQCGIFIRNAGTLPTSCQFILTTILSFDLFAHFFPLSFHSLLSSVICGSVHIKIPHIWSVALFGSYCTDRMSIFAIPTCRPSTNEYSCLDSSLRMSYRIDE